MALFLIVGVVAVLGLSGFIQTSQLKKVFKQQKAVRQHIPMALEACILTAQAGELVRVVEKASLENITAVLILLVIIVASRLGTEYPET